MIKALRVGCAMPQFASATWRFIARGLSPAPEPREIHLEAFSEQAPDRDSRILLSEATDALGLRKARVDWRVSELTSRTIAVFADSVRAEFDRLGLGRVCVSDWVDASSAPSSHFVDTYHHAGTTRMASSPYEGVVDTDCQVFGVEGLFIAGSSVFPTSGAANPVLTIAALAIRVADKLKAKLGFAGWSASDEIPADRPLRAPAYAASRQLD
ncbi:MAG: family oxidoreductase [Rhodospirillales bacterium]|nr:family oxidoreductase [Rhodospirillales bacterium]